MYYRAYINFCIEWYVKNSKKNNNNNNNNFFLVTIYPIYLYLSFKKHCFGSACASYHTSRILKAELMSLTEHPQRNPTYEKGQGRPLPSRGTPLTNLTTVKLSRKRCPETSGRTCVESILCNVYPELYIPPLTQPTNNTPDLYHFTRMGLLC